MSDRCIDPGTAGRRLAKRVRYSDDVATDSYLTFRAVDSPSPQADPAERSLDAWADAGTSLMVDPAHRSVGDDHAPGAAAGWAAGQMDWWREAMATGWASQTSGTPRVVVRRDDRARMSTSVASSPTATESMSAE